MKVIVLSSHGHSTLPEIFSVNYKDKCWRVNQDLIKEIESLDWKLIKSEYMRKSRNENYAMPIKDGMLDGMRYFYATPGEFNAFNAFEIVDVDITRPWCIDDYDDAEYIEYLDDVICLDKELNFYEKKWGL
jgi:hypothetical protein